MSRLMRVDLPEPVVPTMPTTSPGSMTKFMSLSTFFERSNEKLTFLNSMRPSIFSSSLPAPKSCSGSALTISMTFSAEAMAF